MIMTEPIEIKLKLMSTEIEDIIAGLERVPHNLFKFLNCQKIIKKLNEALEVDKIPGKKKNG